MMNQEIYFKMLCDLVLMVVSLMSDNLYDIWKGAFDSIESHITPDPDGNGVVVHLEGYIDEERSGHSVEAILLLNELNRLTIEERVEDLIRELALKQEMQSNNLYDEDLKRALDVIETYGIKAVKAYIRDKELDPKWAIRKMFNIK